MIQPMDCCFSSEEMEQMEICATCAAVSVIRDYMDGRLLVEFDVVVGGVRKQATAEIYSFSYDYLAVSQPTKIKLRWQWDAYAIYALKLGEVCTLPSSGEWTRNLVLNNS